MSQLKMLSQDVDCPWCIAKAGEACWDYDVWLAKKTSSAHAAFRRSDGQVHLARVKIVEVDDDSTDTVERIDDEGNA